MNLRIGFKTAVSNYADGWGERYLSPLIAAGIPPVVGAMDGAGFAYEAQEAMKAAGWSYEKQRTACLVFRTTENDIPNYRIDPRDAADAQWAWHSARWPIELDRKIVYGGITNESAFVLGEADLPEGGGPYRKWFQHVENDGNWKWDNSEWLAAHAYRLCEHALAAGVRFTVFGFAPGTPESWQWRGPEMTKLLDLLRKHPDDLAIDLHEGSMTVENLDAPYLIGRWRNVPQPWPTMIFTEFGWTLREAPVVEVAMPQLLDAYREHYAYDHIKGVVLWSLTKGASWGDIGATVNTYMAHIAYAMLNLDIPPLADETPLPPPPNPEPPMPDETLEEVLWERATSAAPTNLDAALQKHILSTANYTPYGPEKWVAYEGLQYATQAAMDWGNMRQRVYWCRVPEWDKIYFIDDPEATLEFVVWPVKRTPAVTQAFGARPEVYQQYGFPGGHEGIDLRANLNDPVLAVADGMVLGIHEGGNYGKYIKIAHAGGWVTLYAHLNAFAMLDVGDYVVGGQTIGFAGTTGNSTGTHLHLGLSHVTSTYTDANGNRWPKGIHDPTDYLKPFMATPPTPAGLDLLPYIKGDGTIYQMKVIWQGQEHSQQMQTQTGYGNAFYLVKNNEWEEFYFDSEYIHRGIDTSPGNGMYYWQRQNALETKARWCLRIRAAGQTYERNPLVTFYDKNTGLKLANPASDYRRSWLRLAKHHASWRHPQGAMPFADVVELHWLLKPDAITPAETYFYAKNYGLVGWSSSNGDYSFVVEVFRPGERSPMVRESITIR